MQGAICVTTPTIVPLTVPPQRASGFCMWPQVHSMIDMICDESSWSILFEPLIYGFALKDMRRQTGTADNDSRVGPGKNNP